MEDRQLVIKCKNGSSEALRSIYQKYKTDLLVLAIALSNDKSAAEDIVHDVFVSFVQSLEKFRLTGTLKGYLLTCVANRARNSNKAKHHQNVTLDQAVSFCSDLNGPASSLICNEQLLQLCNSMGQIPYEQREVILLHLHSGMKFKTIAGQLEISVNTVKSRYRYGIERLRSIFEGKKNETG